MLRFNIIVSNNIDDVNVSQMINILSCHSKNSDNMMLFTLLDITTLSFDHKIIHFHFK
jgi:hypothetical protein